MNIQSYDCIDKLLLTVENHFQSDGVPVQDSDSSLNQPFSTNMVVFCDLELKEFDVWQVKTAIDSIYKEAKKRFKRTSGWNSNLNLPKARFVLCTKAKIGTNLKL